MFFMCFCWSLHRFWDITYAKKLIFVVTSARDRKDVYLLPTCYLASLCLVAHKASTKCLQFSLLAAAALGSSHVRHPALFLSLSTVLRQVVLGFPLFLFPSGVHDRAMLVWLFLFCCRTCPIIFHLLLLTSSLRNFISAFSRSSLVVTWPCHFILRILLRHIIIITETRSRNII